MFKGSRFRKFRFRGFTLMENLIVFALVGIFSAMAAPSFAQMLDARKLDQSMAVVQTSLSAAHRQAIRKGDICEVGILSNQSKNDINASAIASNIYSECLTEEDQRLGEKVVVVSNILPLETPVVPQNNKLVDNSTTKIGAEVFKWCIDHEDHAHDYWEDVCGRFRESPDDAPHFSQVVFNAKGGVSFNVTSASDTPPSPTGKVVFYNRGQSDKTKCLAISMRLGLTRQGSYSGNLDPKSITDSGECTARKWTKQYS